MSYKQGFLYLSFLTLALVSFGIASAEVVTSLDSITITYPADKLTYNVGESLDITGLVVTGTYSCTDVSVDGDGEETYSKCVDGDGEEADKIYKIELVTDEDVTGFNSSVPFVGQVLTVMVGDKTATYTVDIVAAPVPTLSSIAIATPANKLTYSVGDVLDLTGLVVVGTYSDGSTSMIEVYDISGFDSSAPVDAQVITISVGEIETTFTVKIVAAVDSTPVVRSGGGGGGSARRAPAVAPEVLGAATDDNENLIAVIQQLLGYMNQLLALMQAQQVAGVGN